MSSFIYNNKVIILISFILIINDIKANNKIDTLQYSNFDFLKKQSLGQDLVINKIIIQGNKRTKSNIISRELSFSKNDTIPYDEFKSVIEEDKRKIINTNLFNEVEIKFLIVENNLINIIIELVEGIFWSPNIVFELSDRNINDWWVNFNHDFKRINYGLGFEHENITGRNDLIFFLATFGFIRQFEIEYSNPYITKEQKGGINFGFYFVDSDHLEYNSIAHIPVFYKSETSLNKTLETYIEYSHRESFYNYHYFTLLYQNTRIKNSIRTLNDNYFSTLNNRNELLTLSYEFDRDFRDFQNYPLKGFRLNAKIEKTGIGIFNDVNKWKAKIYYARYFQFKKKFFYSFNLFTYTSSNNQPYYIYEDESELLRGYETYLIHGHTNLIYRNTIKKELFSVSWNIEKFNFKKFKNFPLRTYLKIFFDSGYVWGYSNNNLNTKFTDKYLYSSGIGIDFISVKNYGFSTEFSRNGEGKYNFFLNFDLNF